MKLTVLGAGGWGTALAKLLCEAGHVVSIWGHDPCHLNEVQSAGCNHRYLPSVALPKGLSFEPDLARAIGQAEGVVLAIPSRAFREVAAQLRGFAGVTVSVTKGIDFDSGKTMSEILSESAPSAQVVALSGPTLALEVARGIPTACVASSPLPASAQLVQKWFHRPAFRVYTSPDIVGVELGGALKNVIAIAAGTSDGLGFGDNSKAALITRGIVEMRRLGVARGALPDTFSGLSGLGDLTVTCFSKLSRNRTLGERLGKGERLEDILKATETIAEGHPTARAAHRLARHLGVSTPIMDEVYSMLYEGKNIARALADLTRRDSKPEEDAL